MRATFFLLLSKIHALLRIGFFCLHCCTVCVCIAACVLAVAHWLRISCVCVQADTHLLARRLARIMHCFCGLP